MWCILVKLSVEVRWANAELGNVGSGLAYVNQFRHHPCWFLGGLVRGADRRSIIIHFVAGINDVVDELLPLPTPCWVRAVR